MKYYGYEFEQTTLSCFALADTTEGHAYYMYAFMSHYTLSKSMHIETYLHCSNHTEGTQRLYFETHTRYIHILIYGN